MPVTPTIKPFLVDSIISLLKDTFGELFKTYYFGDPLSIPSANMPCIFVEKVSSQIRFGATGTDQVVQEIVIQVIVDKKEHVGSEDNESPAQRPLMEIVEGRDGATGEYLENSILGVIRTNATLGDLIIDQDVSIDYATDFRGDDTYTKEASIRITATENVSVSNRS